jgi:hypothetical protein
MTIGPRSDYSQAVLALVLGAYVVFATLAALPLSQSGVPFYDEWDEVTARDIAHNLLAQHNEHRIFVPRLVFLADKILFSGTNIFNLTVIVGSQLVLAALLIGLMAKAKLDSRGWMMGLVLASLFSSYQYQNFFWGHTLGLVLVNLLAAVSFVIVAYGDRTWRATLLAAAFGILAALSLASGMLVLCILPALAAVLGYRSRQIALLAVIPVVAVFLYLIGYKFPEHHSYSAGAISNLPRVAAYALVYLGAPIAQLIASAAIPIPPRAQLYLAAGIGLLAVLATGCCGYWAFRNRQRLAPAHWVLLALVAFTSAGAAMTAIGRYTFPLDQAASSRYGAPVLLFWIGLLLLAWASQSIAPSRIGGTAPFAASVLLVLLAVHERDVMTLARNWREPQLAVKTALLTGAVDLKAFGRIYHHPQALADAAERLRQEMLSPFNEPWAAWRGKPLTIPVVTEDCLGWLDAIEQISPGTFKARGWAWDAGAGAPVAKLVLVDDANQVVGFALGGIEARPDVIEALPQITSLRSGWSGHFLAAAPTTIRAVALLDGDRRACRLLHFAAHWKRTFPL